MSVFAAISAAADLSDLGAGIASLVGSKNGKKAREQLIFAIASLRRLAEFHDRLECATGALNAPLRMHNPLKLDPWAESKNEPDGGSHPTASSSDVDSAERRSNSKDDDVGNWHDSRAGGLVNAWNESRLVLASLEDIPDASSSAAKRASDAYSQASNRWNSLCKPGDSCQRLAAFARFVSSVESLVTELARFGADVANVRDRSGRLLTDACGHLGLLPDDLEFLAGERRRLASDVERS